jgi:diguanylate cyclase (GGDEF)-like protein
VVLSLTVMLLPTAVLVGSSLFAFQRLFAAVEEIVSEVADEIRPMQELQSLLLEPARAIRDYALRQDPGSRASFEAGSARVDEAFRHLNDTVPFARAEERDLLRAAQEQWRAAAASGQRVLSASQPASETGPGQDDYGRFEGQLAQLERFFPMLLASARQEVEDERARVVAEVTRVHFHVGAIFALGVSVALVAGLLLRRAVLSPLRELQEGAHRFGGGDLSYRIPLTGPEELRDLAAAFNVMARRLQEGHSALIDLSLRDPLTRVFNRREFFARLGDEVERAQCRHRPLALLMLDIDHFKAVNDAHGHPAGDAALRAVAQVLRSAIRPVDTVARYGGEEFAVLLPNTTPHGGAAIARRLAAGIGSQVLSVGKGEHLALTVSIGVASLPADATSAEELLTAADDALYRAKRGGRNRVATSHDGGAEPYLRLVDPAGPGSS